MTAPLAFSLAIGDPEEELFQALAGAGTNPNNFSLERYMGDIPLIVAPMVAEECYTELRDALTKAGVKLNEDKRTTWAADGNPHDTYGENPLGKRA